MATQHSRSYFWSACLGNFFEHYDTALFGFLSPFLASLIFPEQEPMTALILTYAIIPLGMLARPIGAIIFGYIGDTYGRQQALFLSLCGMATISGCIALSPTYQQVGIMAPLIFALGRIMQNLLAAGEIMGGAIFLLENSPEKKHDLLSSFYNASTIGGILLASAGVSLLSSYELIDRGWRYLYLIGCLTALFGCMIRRHLVIDQLKPTSLKLTDSLLHIVKSFWIHRKALVLIAIISGFSYANYSIALILMNGFIPLISPLTKTEMMHLNTMLLILDFFALPFFGWVCLKVSREKVMLSASLGVLLSAIPLFMLLQDGAFIAVVGVRICFVLFGVASFAPFHAWAQQLVPSSYRYAIISFGYAIGSQLLGGPTAALSLWLFQVTGMVSSVAWYWVLLAFASSLILLKKILSNQPLSILTEST